jgi:hypothetical protein
MVLEAITNLPEETIERLARRKPDERRVRAGELHIAPAEHAQPANLDAVRLLASAVRT